MSSLDFDQLCYKFKVFELSNAKLNKIKYNSDNNRSFDIKIKYRIDSKIETKLEKFSLSADNLVKMIDLKLPDIANQYSTINLQFIVQFNQEFKNKLSNLFTKLSIHDSEFKFSNQCQIDLNSTNYNNDLTMNLTDSYSNEYKLTFGMETKIFSEPLIRFILEKFPFDNNILMNSIKHLFTNFGLDLVEYKEDEKGSRAQHAIKVNLGRETANVYELEMFHVFTRKWSSIRLKDLNDRILASSHLIGLDQLPSLVQFSSKLVKYDQQKVSESVFGTILDSRFEKAILVKNLLDEDFAIIKGKWVGKRAGVPGVRATRNTPGKRGIPGSPGYLTVSFHLIKNNTIEMINITNTFVFSVKSLNLKAEVDLKTNTIKMIKLGEFVDNLEIESLLVSVFSIAVLHVMLQPKMLNKPQITQTTTNNRRQVRTIDIDRNYMLGSVTQQDTLLLYNTAFITGFDGCGINYPHHHHHHHCHHDHLHHDNHIDTGFIDTHHNNNNNHLYDHDNNGNGIDDNNNDNHNDDYCNNGSDDYYDNNENCTISGIDAGGDASGCGGI